MWTNLIYICLISYFQDYLCCFSPRTWQCSVPLQYLASAGRSREESPAWWHHTKDHMWSAPCLGCCSLGNFFEKNKAVNWWSISVRHLLWYKFETRVVSHLSLDESMCLSVFVKVSHGNTENFRHLTVSCTVKQNEDLRGTYDTSPLGENRRQKFRIQPSTLHNIHTCFQNYWYLGSCEVVYLYWLAFSCGNSPF